MSRFDEGTIEMQELLRGLAEQVVNAVMDAEADQLCGDGANGRNGYRERSLATCVGTMTQRIPKLRSGSFFSEDVLERHQRVDRALVAAIAAVAEMYATGTSTRKVQRVAEKMGVSRLSEDQVSATASSLDADIENLCEGRSTARWCPTSGSMRPASCASARGASSQPPRSPPSAAMRAAGGASWASTWLTPSLTTRRSPSCGLSARVGRRACGSSSRTPTPDSSVHSARSSRAPRGSAARLPHARLHARGRFLAAQAPRG